MTQPASAVCVFAWLILWLCPTVSLADTYARWELDEAAYTEPAVDSSGNNFTATYTIGGGVWGKASKIDAGKAIEFYTNGGTSITPVPAALVPADKEYSIETAFRFYGAGQQSVFYLSKDVSPYEGIEVRLNFGIAFITTAGSVSFRDGEYTNADHMCVATGSYNNNVMRMYKFQRLQRANGSWYIRIVIDGVVVCEKTIASIYVHDHTTETLYVASRDTAALFGIIEYTRFYIGSFVNILRPRQVVARWEQDEASAGVAVYDSSYNGWDGIQEGGGTFGVASVIDDGTAITYGALSAAYIASTPSGLYFLDQEFTVEMAFSTDSTGQRTIFGQWQQTANYQGVEALVNYDGAAVTGGDGTIALRSGDYADATYACPTPPGYNDNVIRVFRFERRRIATSPDVWVLRVLVNGVIKCQKTLPSLVTHTYPDPPTYIASRTTTAGIVGTVEYTRFYIGAHYSDFGYTNATSPSVTLSTIETTRAALMQAIFGQSTLPTTTRQLEGFALPFGTPSVNYNLLNGTGTPWFFDRGTGNTRLIVYAGTKYQLLTAKGGDAFIQYCLLMTPNADILALSSLDWPHENRDLSEFLEPAVESLNYAFALRNYTDVTFVGFGSGGWVASVLCGLDARITRCFDVAGSWPFFVRAAQTEVVFNEYEERLPGLESVIPADYLDLYVLASTLSASYTQVFNVEDDCCFSTLEGRDYLQAVRAVVASVNGSYSQRYFNDTDGHVIPKDAYALLSGHDPVTAHWPLDELAGSVVTDVIGGYELNRYAGLTPGEAPLNGDGGYSMRMGVNLNCLLTHTTVNDFAVRRRPFGVKFWTHWQAGWGPHWTPVWIRTEAYNGPSIYCNMDGAFTPAMGYCAFIDETSLDGISGIISVGDGTWNDGVTRHHAAQRVCVGTEPCRWKLQYFIDGFLYNETDIDSPTDAAMWDTANPADSVQLYFGGRKDRTAYGDFDDLWFASGDSFSSAALSVESGGLTTETVKAFWRFDEASAASPAVDSISGFDGAYTSGGTYSVASVIDTGTAITFAGTGGMKLDPTPDGLHILDREWTLEIAFSFTGTGAKWLWIQYDSTDAADPGIAISLNFYGSGSALVGGVGLRETRYDADYYMYVSGSYNDGVVRRWKFQRVLVSRSPDVWAQRISINGVLVGQKIIPLPMYHYYPGELTYVVFDGATFSGTIEYTRIYAGAHQSERLYTNATGPCVTRSTLDTYRTNLRTALFGSDALPATARSVDASAVSFGSYTYDSLSGSVDLRFFDRGTSNTKLIVYHGTHDRLIQEQGGSDFMTYVLDSLPESDLLAVEVLPWPWEDRSTADMLMPAIESLNYAFSVRSYTEVVFTGLGGGGWAADLMCSIDARITHCFNVAGSWPFSVRNAHTDGLSNGEVFEHLHGLESVIPCDYFDLYVLASTNTLYYQVFNLGDLYFNTDAGLGYLHAVRSVAESRNGTYRQKYVNYAGEHQIQPELYALVTRQPSFVSTWNMDETTGSTAIVDSTHIVNLTLAGGATFEEPALGLDGGTAVTLNGVDGYFSTDTARSLSVRYRPYCVDTWLKYTITFGSVLFGHFGAGGDGLVVFLNTNDVAANSPGQITIRERAGASNEFLESAVTTFNNGVARHVAFQRRCVGTEPCVWYQEIYVNGYRDSRAAVTALLDMLVEDTFYLGGRVADHPDSTLDNAHYYSGTYPESIERAMTAVSGFPAVVASFWRLDELSATVTVDSVSGANSNYNSGGCVYGKPSVIDTGTSIEKNSIADGDVEVAATTKLYILDREFTIEIPIGITSSLDRYIFNMYRLSGDRNTGLALQAATAGPTLREETAAATYTTTAIGSYYDGVIRRMKFQRIMRSRDPEVWVHRITIDGVIKAEQVIPEAVYMNYAQDTYVMGVGTSAVYGTWEYVRIYAGPHPSSERLYANATAPCVTADTVETVRGLLMEELFGQATVPSTARSLSASGLTFGAGSWTYDTLTGLANPRYFNRGTNNTKLIIYHGTADRTIEEDGGADFMAYVLQMLPEADLLAVEFLLWPWENRLLEDLLLPVIESFNYAVAQSVGYTEVVFVGYGTGGWVADLVCSLDSRVTDCFNVAGSWPFYVRNEHTDGLSNGETFEHLHGLEAVIPCDYLDLYVLASTNTRYMQVFNLGYIRFNSMAALEYLPAVRAVTAQLGAVYKQKYVEDTGGTLVGNRVPPEVYDLVTRQPVQRSNWPFDEITGTNAEDVISGNNLTYTGGVTLNFPPLTLVPEGSSLYRLGSGTGIYDDMPVSMKIRNREYSFDLWMANSKVGSRVKTWYHHSGVDGAEINYNTNGASSPVNGYVTFVVQSINVVRLVATPTTLSDGIARHFGFERKCAGTEPCQWVGSLLINGFLDGNVSLSTVDDLLSTINAGDQLCIGGTNGYPQQGLLDDPRYTVGESQNYAALAARVVAGVSESFEARWELDEASAAEAAVESVNGWDATYTAGGTYSVASQMDNGTAITFAGTGATQVTSTPDGLWLLDREYVIECAFSFTDTVARTLFGQYDSVDSNNPGAHVAVNYDGGTVEGAVQFRDQRTTTTFVCNTYGTYNDGVMRVWIFKRIRKYITPTVWVLQTFVDGVLVCEKTIPYPLYHYYPGEPTVVAAMPSQSFEGTIEYTRIRAGPVTPVATSNATYYMSPASNASFTLSGYVRHESEYPVIGVPVSVSPPEAGTIVGLSDPEFFEDADNIKRSEKTATFVPNTTYSGVATLTYAATLDSGAQDTNTITFVISLQDVKAFWRFDEASAASPAVDSLSGFDGAYTAGGTYSVASVVDTGTAVTFASTGDATIFPVPDGLWFFDLEYTIEQVFSWTSSLAITGFYVVDAGGVGPSVRLNQCGDSSVPGGITWRESRYDTDYHCCVPGGHDDGVIRRWKFQRILKSRAPDVWALRAWANGVLLCETIIPGPLVHYYEGSPLILFLNPYGTHEYTRAYAGPHQTERNYTNATAPCVTADTVATTRAALVQALFDQPGIPAYDKLNVSSSSTFGTGSWSYDVLNSTTHMRYFDRGTLNERLLVYHGTTDRTIEEDGGDDFMEYVLHMLPEVDLLAVEFLPWPWEGKTYRELLRPALQGIAYALEKPRGTVYTDVVFVGYGAGGWVADLVCSFYAPITYCFNVAGSWPFYVRNEHTDGLSSGEVFEHLHGLQTAIPCDYLDLYVLASTRSYYTQVFNLGGIRFNSLAGLDYLPAVRAVTASFNDTYKQRYVEDTGGTLTGNRIPPEVYDLVTVQPVARAQWPFDESAGSVAEDVISGNDLSYYSVTLGQTPLADDGGTSVRLNGVGGGVFGTVPVALKPRWRKYSFELWTSNTRVGTYVKTFQQLQNGVGKYGLYYNYAGTSVTNGRVQWDPQGNPVVRVDATGSGLSDGVARHWAVDRTCVGTEPCQWVGSVIVDGFLDNNASIPVREDLMSAVGSTDTMGICGTPGSYYQTGYADDARFVVGEGHNLAEIASRIVSGVSETFEARWELDDASAGEAAVESVNGWDATYTAGGTYGVASQVDNGTAITFAGTGAATISSTPDGLWLLDREYTIEIALAFTGSTAYALFGQYDKDAAGVPGPYVATNWDGSTSVGDVHFREMGSDTAYQCTATGSYNDGVMRTWKFQRIKKYINPTVWVLRVLADNVNVCEKTIAIPLYHHYPGIPTRVVAHPTYGYTGTIEYVYIRAGRVDPVATSYTQIVRNTTTVNLTATVRAIDTQEYPAVHVKSTVSPLAAGSIATIYDPVYTIGSRGEYITTVTIAFEPDLGYTEHSFITFSGLMISGNTDIGTITVIPFHGDLVAIDEVVEGVHPYFPILVYISALGWKDTVAEFNTSGIVMPLDAGMISDFSNVTTTVDENGDTISTVSFEFTPFANFTDNATVDFTVYNDLFEAVDVGIVTLIGPQFTNTTTLYRNGSQAHKLVAYYRMSTQNLEDTTIPNLVTGVDAAFGDLQLSLGNGVSWNDGGAGLVFDSVSDPQRVISTATSGNLRDSSDNNKDFAIEVWFRHMSGSGEILSIGNHAFIRHDGVTGLTWEVDGVSDRCTEPLGTETWGGKQLDSANTSYWNPVPVDSAPANATISFVLSVGANNERDEMPIAPTVEGPGTVGYEPFCYYCQFPPCSMRSESITVPSSELNYSAWGSCTSTNNLAWEEFQPFVCQGLFNSGASGSSHGEDVAFRQFVHVGTEADHKSFTPSDLPLFSMMQLGSLDSGTWHGIIYQVAIYAADTNQNYYSNNNAADTFIAAGIGQGADTSVAERNYEDGLAQTAYTESSKLVYAQDVSLNYTFSFIGYGLQASPLNFSVISGPTPATAGTLSAFSGATTTLTDTEVTISNSSIEFYPDYDFEDNATVVFRVTSYDGSISDECTVTIVGIPFTQPTAEAVQPDTIVVPLESSCFDIVLQGLGARNRPMTFYIEEELSPASLGNLSDFAEVAISVHTDNRTLSNTSVTFCPTAGAVGTATFVFRVQTDKGNVTDTAVVTLVFEEPHAPASSSTRTLSGGAIAVLAFTGLFVFLLLAYAAYRIVKMVRTGGPSYTIVRGWALPANPKM